MSQKLGMKKKKEQWAKANPEKHQMLMEYKAAVLESITKQYNSVSEGPILLEPGLVVHKLREYNIQQNESISPITKNPYLNDDFHRDEIKLKNGASVVKYTEKEEEIAPFNSNLNCEEEKLIAKHFCNNLEEEIITIQYKPDGSIASVWYDEEAPQVTEEFKESAKAVTFWNKAYEETKVLTPIKEEAPKGLLGKIKNLFKGNN